MHVLLDDDLGRLTLRRLRPWHRLLARGLAPRLDRQLADGARPEANAVLAARAMVLTSVGYRRGLAASLRRMLAASVSAAGAPAARWPRRGRLAPRVSRMSRSAGTGSPGPLRAGGAGRLPRGAGPGPGRGVAMVSQLLADGGGPLYRAGCRDDLNAIIERAAQALTGSRQVPQPGPDAGRSARRRACAPRRRARIRSPPGRSRRGRAATDAPAPAPARPARDR